ncbi:MAG: hypothetical protein PVI09_18725 [Anaerolineae bacterium]|jgi:hypothetical protein
MTKEVMEVGEFAAKIPLKYLREFELEPIIFAPGDVFPYGIIIRDWLMEAMPERIERLERVGLTPMLMPTKRAVGGEFETVRLPMEAIKEFELDPMVVFPDDVFPYGIPVPFVWFEKAGRPEMFEKIQEMGWAAAFVPMG